MNRSVLSRWSSFALVVLFLLGKGASFTRAQNAQPAPTPQVAPPPQPTPTPTALPSATPGVAATPSPASLPSIVPQAPTAVLPRPVAPSVGFSDPNIIAAPPPLLVPTPTPLPQPTETPIPLPESGVIEGQEPPSDAPFLDAPGGVIYDTDRGLALAQGEVTLGYGNFRAKGQRGVINEKTGDATLTGDLTIYAQQGGRTQVFTGKTLLFNIKTGKWLLSQLQATFPPELFPPGTVLAPLYETNGSVSGQDDNAVGENFRFTSCDREHYYLRSNRINFYRTPEGTPSRIVLRRNALYIFHRKILPLPVYSISLLGQTSRRQPLQTTFGQNAQDGFFAKTIVNIGATPKLTDSLLVDALSKRGLGLGIQRLLAGGGLLYLYSVTGKTGGREVNAVVKKSYQLTEHISSTIDFNSTQNNSVAGSGAASRNGNFSLSRVGSHGATTLNYSQSQSSYSNSDVSSTNSTSRNDSLLLNHQQSFGRGIDLNVAGALNQSTYELTGSSDSINQTGDLDVLLTKGGAEDLFNISIHTELHNDFRQANNAYQLERLPELLLTTDSQRLLPQSLSFLNKYAPGTLSVGLGTFNEPGGTFGDTTYGGRRSRADFVYNLSGQELRVLGNNRSPVRAPGQDALLNQNLPLNQDPLNSGFIINDIVRRPSGVTVTPSAYFEQSFYTGDTARYNYAYGLNNTNTLGPIQLSLSYNKQRTSGFTPFQFDYYSPSEGAYYTASYVPNNRFSVNLSGSRDIQNSYTNDTIFNLQWLPLPGASFTLATSYGFEGDRRGLLGDIIGNFIFNRRRANAQTQGTQFSLGVRYTPSGTGINQGLTRVNAQIDTNITRKLRLQAYAGYDGVNKRFDFQQYRAVVDLHCFNLYTTYDGSRKEFRVDLALKAFPFADTRFGRNRLSEGFDPSVGGIQ